jgi:hypothetical protein
MFSHARQYRLATFLAALLVAFGAATAADMKPEDLVQKHLASIGSPEVRAAAKSRVMEGNASYRILVGGSGELEGKATLVSEGDKMLLQLKINALKYHGEKFVRNGGKTFVSGTYDDGSRSELGEFLRAEDVPLRDGLLGGVLSTDWALLDMSKDKGKLHYDGLKKVDGVEYQVVSYHAKKNADLDITLYFEPETFRHAMTVYTASVHAGIAGADPNASLSAPAGAGRGSSRDLSGGTDSQSARQQPTRYRIEERFSDFQTADGLTLPSHYELKFSSEQQMTKVVDWDIKTTRVLSNVPLNDKNFEIH